MKCHVTLVPGRFALEFSSVGQALSDFFKVKNYNDYKHSQK